MDSEKINEVQTFRTPEEKKDVQLNGIPKFLEKICKKLRRNYTTTF